MAYNFGIFSLLIFLPVELTLALNLMFSKYFVLYM